MDAIWIIIAGSLAAVCCSTLGCFLVLRRMALVGDAISHAVLPGIVLVFLITGSRASIPMLLGAGAFGLLTTFLIEFLHRTGKLQSDASVGVSFTVLFALGVILLTAFAGQVDLDQDCVLYGEIAYVPLDIIRLGDYNIGPKAIWVLGSVLILVLLFVYSAYKELILTTFDPQFATALGLNIVFWHYALMAMVSLTTVASFESVGAILVVALLIVPAATAQMLTKQLHLMLLVAGIIGVLSAAGGYFLAVAIDGSIAGAIATLTGIFFLLALLFSPTQGYFFQKRNAKRVPNAAAYAA